MATNKLTEQQLKELVLASFEAERTGNVKKNLSLVTDDFKYVDITMNDSNGSKSYFPGVGGQEARDLMTHAFKIKDRIFEFKTVVADEPTQTVVVEFIESYPDLDTGKRFRTPQVAICNIKDGKIYRTRHYMDPRLSFEHLSEAELNKVFED